MTQAQPPLGHVVSLADIYTQLVVLTAKVDGVLASHATIEHTISDHESRIRGLERSRWPLPSVAILASVGAAITAVVALLSR